MNPASSRLLLILDLAGTFVFGLEGAMAATVAGLDLLGIVVLSFTVALGGGLIRDVLIGASPPAAIRDWRYPATAFAAGAVAFCSLQLVQRVPSQLLLVLDAAGLALFAVAGTEKALDYRIHPFIAVLMGGITGAGGGILRDLLLTRIPLVLRTEIYATAALTAGVIVVLGRRWGLSNIAAAFLGGVACFALRLISVWQHWNLPKLLG